MKDVYIVQGARTAIGSFMGLFSSISSTRLGATAIKAAIDRSRVSLNAIDEVIMGNVLSSGVGQAPARQAAMYAGVPENVPALTINKVCGSGMKSVMLAAQSIRVGDADIVVAGGMESMSNAPYLLDKARTGYRMGNGTLVDSMIVDGLWDPYHNVHMGNCGDKTAKEYHFTREDLDVFSYNSYKKALNASENGSLEAEICPVEVSQKKSDPLIVEKDEELLKANPEKLSLLRAAFNKDGVITAGNASSINDGAAALVISSEEGLNKIDSKPLAKIVSAVTYAGNPEWFTTAPAFAIQKLLDKVGLTVNDIDIFEVNEAFSVVAMIVARQCNIPEEKLNLYGGAVALGHPIGMTGTRLILTAAYQLQKFGKKYAIATPCIGGGEATAVLLEKV